MDEQTKLDALLKLQQVRTEQGDFKDALAKRLRAIARVQEPTLPGHEYEQAKAIANDETGVRDEVMEDELWDRFVSRAPLPGHHEQEFKDSYKMAHAANGPNFAIDWAHNKYKANRDPEILEKDVRNHSITKGNDTLIKRLTELLGPKAVKVEYE